VEEVERRRFGPTQR